MAKKKSVALCAVVLLCGVVIGAVWNEAVLKAGNASYAWLTMLVPPTSAYRDAVRIQPAACERPETRLWRDRATKAVRLLALNIYFHRSDKNTVQGKKAITAVVFNRMHDCKHPWPRTVISVITAGRERGVRCDWSWTCDTNPDKPVDSVRFAQDHELARLWFGEYLDGQFDDPTNGATWVLHKDSPYPESWPDHLVDYGVIGQYRFYGYPR
jgi:spore germination cell wall hydrolase CwlJ-like protein